MIFYNKHIITLILSVCILGILTGCSLSGKDNNTMNTTHSSNNQDDTQNTITGDTQGEESNTIIESDTTEEKKVVVEKGDTIGVLYTGTLPDGTLFDTNVPQDDTQEPRLLTFEVGAGQMIPGFDNGVVGKSVGETFTITLAPTDAYGEKDENQMLKVPLEDIRANITGDLKIGDVMMITMPQGGNINVRIDEINEDTQEVVLDANHELAGETLIFEITIVDIQKS